MIAAGYYPILMMLLTSSLPPKVETARLMKAFDRSAMGQCLDSGSDKPTYFEDSITCFKDELSRRDIVLNEIYRAVQKRLTSKKRLELRDDQRWWITYRDESCRMEARKEPPIPPSGNPFSLYRCKIEKTNQRIEILNEYR